MFSDGTSLALTFADVAAPVVVTLPEPKLTRSVRVVVRSVYRGSKWNDLAVGGFHLLRLE